MKFITKEGAFLEAEKVRDHPKLSPGHHWRNNAHLGSDPVWTETKGSLETVDTDRRELFGYDEKEFMQKQYS